MDFLAQAQISQKPFGQPPFFRTEQEAIRDCEQCGSIAPRYSKSIGRWVRQQCPCQQEAKRKAEQEELGRQIKVSLVRRTYRWLGGDWSDEDLFMKTFANFDQSMQPEGYVEALSFADEPTGTLILHGPFGTGKTHLLAAICNALRERGKESRFTTAPNLFGAIQEAINFKKDHNEYVRLASTTPLLVIDDIDKAKWSEFREEKYHAIIDSRVKRGLPTAISTNRVEDLEKFVGGAVASRLMIGQIAVEMAGFDYRKLL